MFYLIGARASGQHHSDFCRNDKLVDLWVNFYQAGEPVRKHIRDNFVTVSSRPNLRTIISWYNLAVYTYKGNALLVLIGMLFVGMLSFPIVSITLEELVMRTNPGYLVTVQVLCTISSQGIAAVISYGAGFLFKDSSRRNGLIYSTCSASMFTLLLLMQFLVICLQQKENKRPSFIERRKYKSDALKRLRASQGKPVGRKTKNKPEVNGSPQE